MKDLFTVPRLYKDVPDYLYLFAHMATKTMCEAVVEGMGGVWDASAEPRRHPNFETGVMEAVIAWSAPQPWHAAAVPFINAALVHRFKDSKDGRFNFTHVNERTAQLPSWKHGSQVLDRLHKTTPRLPSNLYG